MKTRRFGLILILCVVLTCVWCAAGFAEESYSANTMRLMRYEGAVEIEDASGNPRFIMENARFNSGEAMRTGPESYASVSLDASKIVTLDAQSRVEFQKNANSLIMKLTEGSLLLDVQEKLSDNESLDIQTSTMVVGIRGTIAFLREERDGTSVLGVLEGVAQLSYRDGSDAQRVLDVGAGQKAVLSDPDGDALVDTAPELSVLAAKDVPGLFLRTIEEDPVLQRRVDDAGGLPDTQEPPEEQDPYAADGDWTYEGTVTLVAQSASKMYDGTPLTRPSDVLVYNLPSNFSIRASASGSQTDAGESANTVSQYSITNAAGESVTGHFPSIETVDGVLRVDPAPLTVWTGSAEKEYDGTPLTEPEARLVTYAGYEQDVPPWRNTSFVVTESVGSQNLYGVCGVTWAHGTNPLTGETKELQLYAGQRMSVVLSTENGEESISFEIVNIPEEEIPEELLRLYAENPELLRQACRDADWDMDLILSRIAELPPAEKTDHVKDDLYIREDDEERVMFNSTNVRITIDTDVTHFNGRALNQEEAHYTPIRLEEGVTVVATGSQTPVGESVNGYEISWNGVNPANYVLNEELGTLTVYENRAYVVLTAGSAWKTYDGRFLYSDEVTVSGLPYGFTCYAETEGRRRDAGTTRNVVSDYMILDPQGEDVTDNFSVFTEDGLLIIHKAPLVIKTGSADKPFDGTPLTCDEVEVTGLIKGEKAEVTATGSITDIGTALNTYSVVWDTAKKDNYDITEVLGTLEVTGSVLTVTAGSGTKAYDGTPLTVSEVTVEGLPDGYTLTAVTDGSQTDAGTGVNQVVSYTILNEDGEDYTPVFLDVTLADGTLTVTPAALTITTGSAEKAYDGTPLTSGEATVAGLASGESVTVTATGTITDAGTAENTYTIEWGSTKAANYELTDETGTLTVTKATAKITTGSASKAYDGTPLTSSEVTATGFAAADGITVTADGSITDAGTAENTYTINWGTGKADNYELTDETGTLTVTKAAAKVTTGSATKAYDGTPLTSSEVTATGFAAADGITVTADGTITDAGTAENTYTIDWGTGKADNYELTDETGTLTVTKATAKITTGSASKAYDGTPLTSSEVTVTGFAASDGITVTATGTITDAGTAENTYTIDWGAGKAANYDLTDEPGTLTVTKATAKITTGSASKAYDGTPLTSSEVTATGFAAADGITVTADGTITDAGTAENTYTINWGTGKADNYELTDETGTLTVTKATAKITTGSATKAYDGTPLTSSEVTATGFAAADGITVTADGTITDAGTAENTYTINWGTGKADNYELTDETGTLTVTKATAKITTGSATKAYDGTPLTSSEVTLTGFASADGITVTADGTITDAGTAENTYTINWGTGKADNYELTDETGTLTVTKATAKITTGSATKAYDGTPLTSSEVTLTGFASADGITVAADGTITDAGTAENTYTINWGTGKADNYELTDETGTLTVTKATAKITTGSATKAYDGTPLTSSEVTLTGFAAADGITVTADGTITDAGTAENTYTINWGTGKAANYELTDETGTLTVTKATAKITTGSAAKAYDGTPLTSSEVTLTGFAAADGITVTADGTITDAGTAENTYTIDWGTGKADNYELTDETGTLTVTKATAKITTGSASKAYDGTPLISSEVTATGFAAADGITVTADGTITDAGTAENTYTIDWGTGKADNYELTDETGTLTVTKATAKITTGSASKAYDGTPLTSSEVTATGFAAADGITVTTNGTITDAGTAENTYTIDWGTGKADNYELTDETGTLTVTKATAKITTGSASKAYDGTPLTSSEVTLTGFASADGITVTADGTITDAGTAENTYTINWGAGKADNYELTDETGTLTVTKATAKITTGSASKAYDGTPLTSSEVTATGFAAADGITVTADGSITDAGTEENTYTINWGAGKADNYELTDETGTLTVTKAAVKVTTGSATKPYDSTPLTADEASITGLVPDEAVTVTATGTLTDVGTAENTYSIDWGTVKADNYEITDETGTLTVTTNNTHITITSGSAYMRYKPYDCIAENSSITVDGLPNGLTAEATITAKLSFEVGSIPNTIDSYRFLDSDGKNVASFFTNVELVPGTLTIDKAIVSIWSDNLTKVYDNRYASPTVRWTGIYGMDNARNGIGVSSTASIWEVGSVTDSITYWWKKPELADLYEVDVKPGTLTIEPLQLEVDLGGGDLYPGETLKPTITYMNGNRAGQVVSPSSVTATADGYTANFRLSYEYENIVLTVTGLGSGEVGTHTLTGSCAFDTTSASNFEVSYTNNTVVIQDQATLTITTGSASQCYNGAPLTSGEVSVTGLKDGDTITVTATGSITDAGSVSNTYEIDWGTVNENKYKIEEDLGTLSVTKRYFRWSAFAGPAAGKNQPRPYIGDYYGVNQAADWSVDAGVNDANAFTVSDTESAWNVRTARVTWDWGDVIQIRTEGGGKDVGEYATVCSVSFISGNAANYDVVTETLPLEIVPAELTITTGSASRRYRGVPLTCDEVTVTGLKGGDEITVTPNGSVTTPSSVPNTYDIDWGATNSANYTVTDELGTLTVKKQYISLTACIRTGGRLEHEDVTYTGYVFRVDAAPGYDITERDFVQTTNYTPDVNTYVLTWKWSWGDEIVYRVTGDGAKDAGVYTPTVTPESMTGDPANYEIVIEAYTTTIHPAELTITTESASQCYNGTALTAPAAVAGLVRNDQGKVTVTATGTITDAGTAENTYEIDWGEVKSTNYTITETLGTLEVTPRYFSFTALAGPWEGKDEPRPYTGLFYGVNEASSWSVDWTANNATDFSLSDPVLTPTVREKLVTWDWGDVITFHAEGGGRDIGDYPTTCTATVSRGKASNYDIKITVIPLKIVANDTAVTITAASAEKTYDGTPLEDGTFTAEGLPGGITCTAVVTGSQTDAGTGKNTVDSYKFMHGSEDVTANFTNVTTAEGDLTVHPAQLTITTGSQSKEYDGTPLTADEVSVTGLVPDEPITVTATGTITDVGEADNTYEIDWGTAKADNYKITDSLGTLKVITRSSPFYIYPAGDSRVYDGTPLIVNEFGVEGLPEGFDLQVTLSGSQTDAGSSDNTVSSYRILKGSQDVTSFFTEPVCETGTLEVTPAPLTIATGSAEKAYDGTELTSSEVTVTGLVSGESITVTPTGKITDAGTADNTYTVDWGSTKAANYDLTDETGTLTVTKATAKITTGSATKAYDGTPLTSSEVTATGFAAADGITVTADGSITDAGTAENTYTINWGTGKADNYELTDETGTLTVTKATAKITTGSASKAYDGTPLTSSEVTATGFAPADGITVTADGTITDAGTAENTYTINWGTGKADNYELTDETGTLKVTKATVQVTTESAEKTYDGTPLTAPASVTGVASGDPVSVTVTGTITDVGTQTNTYTIDWGGKEDNYTLSETLGTLKVNKATVQVTTESAEKTYDGTPLTAPASVTGVASGDPVSVTVTGTITDVGTQTNTYTIDWGGKEGNYTLSETLGTLKVTKATVQVTTESAEKTYDGTPLTAPAGVTGVASGDPVSVTVTGTITDVGTQTNTYTIDWGGKEDNYTLSETLGTLKVTKATVHVTTESAEKMYDGTPLTAPAGVTGVASGDPVTVTATGTITGVGTQTNTYTIDWGGKEDNYTLNETLGTLTVIRNNTAITFTAGSDSKTYDGTPLTKDSVTVTNLPSGFTYTAEASGSQTNAGHGENTVSSYKILDGDLNNVTANFSNITTVKGSLDVSRAPLTVRTDSDWKDYDGLPLTAPGASLTGLVNGETATVVATGTITEPGKTDNTYKITWVTADENNYYIIPELGELEIVTWVTDGGGNGYYPWGEDSPYGKEDPYPPEDPEEGDDPAVPSAPADEDDPAAPSAPADEDEPAAPSVPEDKDEPAAPAAPEDKDKPAAPAAPEDKDEPAAPAAPADKDEPAAPAAPAGKDEPAAPAAPPAADIPAAPAAPSGKEDGSSENPGE